LSVLRRAVAAAFLAAAAALPACGGDGDDPTVLPSDTTSSSATTPTTGSSSSAPTSQADQIRAAVRNYYATAERAAATGNVAPLEALSLPTCDCRELSRFIRSESAKGKFQGLVLTVRGIEVHDVSAKTGAAAVKWSESAATLTDDSGKTIKTYPAGTVHDDMHFVRTDGKWLVHDVTGLR
jgi:hypothetical protein